MKTVTIKLRIHKLLAEKRLTKYRFIAMTGLGYKNASRILDNETESIRFSTIARICSALDCTPGDLFEVHEEEDPTMECIKHSETSDFMCGSHAKRAVNRRFCTGFVTALFGDPILSKSVLKRLLQRFL